MTSGITFEKKTTKRKVIVISQDNIQKRNGYLAPYTLAMATLVQVDYFIEPYTSSEYLILPF